MRLREEQEPFTSGSLFSRLSALIGYDPFYGSHAKSFRSLKYSEISTRKHRRASDQAISTTHEESRTSQECLQITPLEALIVKSISRAAAYHRLRARRKEMIARLFFIEDDVIPVDL
ncbi:hypothetical protein PROFUN_07204 [Planoprotostelium fungivorum]|uniref:Uncharacterized protein n=1 Tax=Planoprotostelium fungivorum TaxID=1890364 RepID=A0A2P6NMF6_9EUKA|nr:hypothetical protein PROFUN_07204 [Planoprotostelium fungivorum]